MVDRSKFKDFISILRILQGVKIRSRHEAQGLLVSRFVPLCSKQPADWLSFTADFSEFSMMYSNVLEPRYDVPCPKIPFSSSMASESFLDDLGKMCKVSCSSVVAVLYCDVALSFVSSSSILGSALLLEYES